MPALTTPDRADTLRRIRRLPVLGAVAALAFGLAVLASYTFAIDRLLPLPRLLLPTQPLAAVLFVLTGTSLLALQTGLPRLQRYAAILATLIAAAVLVEYVLGVDLGVDLLIYPATALEMSRVFPGRPAPVTTAAFLLLGLALVIVALRPGDRPRRTHTGIVLAAIVLPMVPIVGHLLHVPELHTFVLRIGTALPTALVLLLLAVGVGTATHEPAVVSLMRGRDPGTTLLRLLLPLAVLLPLFFAAASVGALHLGLYEIHVGLVVFVSGCIGMFLGFAFWIVDMVRRADAERRAADRAQTELAIQDHRLRAETAAAVAAREGERQTRELLTILSHAPVMARGLDGRVRFWSAGAERLYGWTAEQATGALARTLLPTAFPTLEREAEAALLEHGEWHAELSRRARDGTVVQVASHWILHRDEIGRPDAVIEVDKDVTEQLRAQDAFQRGEARYRALVAATARVVWTTSADGKRSIELGQWLAFTGQTALEADWGGWLRAIHPDDQSEATRIWEESVRERRPMLTEHRLRRRDGEYRHMEVRAVPVLDEQGVVREWVGAHADITDRVKAQEQLGQAQKLQAVGTLAGGVAHEVNNQLMAVLGFGDFVLKELGAEHPQTADVEEMIRGATRAARVAQQLLTFSRRQVNQTRLLSLHAAIEGLSPVLERLLGADKALVVLEPRSQRQVLADPTQVDQVLINLAANARDAMGTGGRLTIGIDDVTPDASYARAHTLNRIARALRAAHGVGYRLRHGRDDAGQHLRAVLHHQAGGAGHRARALDRLRHREAARRIHLGLQRARAGHRAEGLPPGRGRGCARRRGSTADPIGERPSGLDAHIVLVVEDEPSVRNLVRRSLEAVGLTVLEATNGRQALETVATMREPPSLVLTDVIMPGLNGRELSEALALTQPDLPVLFMSGYTGDDVLARSLLPATAPFIQKPFAPEELVTRVRMLLAGVAEARR